VINKENRVIYWYNEGKNEGMKGREKEGEEEKRRINRF